MSGLTPEELLALRIAQHDMLCSQSCRDDISTWADPREVLVTAVERIVAERERATLARVTALLADLEQPASECGEEEAKREYAAEGDAEMVALIGDHYPTKYKPYCDGCAAASSADSERGEIAKQLRAAIEGGDQ